MEYVCVGMKDKADLVEEASLWPAEGMHRDVRVGSNGVAVQEKYSIRSDSQEMTVSMYSLQIHCLRFLHFSMQYWPYTGNFSTTLLLSRFLFVLPVILLL